MDLRKKLKKLKKTALPRRGVSAAKSDLSKRQPHLVPRGISMGGFVRHTLILKPEFCVVGEQTLLAGQHQPLAALLPGIGNGLVTDVGNRDLIAVQSELFMLAAFFLLIGLLVDLLHRVLDPRLKSADDVTEVNA